MRTGRQVIDAIDDALIIRQRNPALFAKVALTSNSIAALVMAYEAWLAGVTTPHWFTGERTFGRNRKRAAGKRQRQARKIQQRKARS